MTLWQLQSESLNLLRQKKDNRQNAQTGETHVKKGGEEKRRGDNNGIEVEPKRTGTLNRKKQVM